MTDFLEGLDRSVRPFVLAKFFQPVTPAPRVYHVGFAELLPKRSRIPLDSERQLTQVGLFPFETGSEVKLASPLISGGGESKLYSTFGSNPEPERMSQNVTVRGSADPSATVEVNTGYLRSGPGLLRFLQVLLGAIIIGIVAYHFDRHRQLTTMLVPEVFYLIVAVAALIGSFCLLLSSMLSVESAAVLPQTLFVPVFEGFCFLFTFLSDYFYVLWLSGRNTGHKHYEAGYHSKMFAWILGLLNALLYLWSFATSLRRFRKI